MNSSIDSTLVRSALVLAFTLVGGSSSALPLAVGDLVVTDNETGRIVRVDPVTGTQQPLACALTNLRPQGLVATVDEVIFVNVPSALALDAEIVRLDDQQCAPLSQAGDLRDSDGLARGAGGELFASSLQCPSCAVGSPPAVIQVDPNTGAQQPVSFGAALIDPEQIAVRGDGLLYLTDDGCGNCVPSVPPAVFLVDPATGMQTLVSEGDLFENPSGIALEADGKLLVADRGCSSCIPAVESTLLRIDPTLPPTANQTLLASALPNQQFDGVVVDAGGSIFAGVENSLADVGGVNRIDPQSGLVTPLTLGVNLEDVDGIALVPQPSATASSVIAILTLVGSSCWRLRRGARPAIGD